MEKVHLYHTEVQWTGNRGEGTLSYKSYDRSHTIQVDGKPVIEGSSDPAFRGDPGLFNPEEMFLASISACHMLWYLHLCAVNGVVVTSYTDRAIGEMEEQKDGGGAFSQVILQPTVQVADVKMVTKARSLHREAHEKCFIANSCNFPIRHSAEVISQSQD